MFKKVLVLIAMIGFSASAFAADYAYPEKFKTSYTIDSFLDGGGNVYYNCDSVESNTKSLLKELGAENVKVSCSGGFDQFSGFTGPAYVTVRFVGASMTKNNATPRLASVKEVKLRRYDDCHFLKSTLEGLEDTLQLEVTSGPGTCWSGHASSNFVVNVLAFD